MNLSTKQSKVHVLSRAKNHRRSPLLSKNCSGEASARSWNPTKTPPLSRLTTTELEEPEEKAALLPSVRMIPTCRIYRTVVGRTVAGEAIEGAIEVLPEKPITKKKKFWPCWGRPVSPWPRSRQPWPFTATSTPSSPTRTSRISYSELVIGNN